MYEPVRKGKIASIKLCYNIPDCLITCGSSDNKFLNFWNLHTFSKSTILLNNQQKISSSSSSSSSPTTTKTSSPIINNNIENSSNISSTILSFKRYINDSFILGCRNERTYLMTNLKSVQKTLKNTKGSKGAHSLELNSKKNLLFIGNGNKSIEVWNLNSWKLLHTFTSPDKIEVKESVITDLVCWYDQRLYASGFGKIYIWDLINMKCINIIQGFKGYVQCLRNISEYKLLCAGSLDGIKLLSFDQKTLAQVKNIYSINQGWKEVRCVYFCRGFLFAGNDKGELHVYHVQRIPNVLATCKGHDHPVNSLCGIGVHEDRKDKNNLEIFFASAAKGACRIWKFSSLMNHLEIVLEFSEGSMINAIGTLEVGPENEIVILNLRELVQNFNRTKKKFHSFIRIKKRLKRLVKAIAEIEQKMEENTKVPKKVQNEMGIAKQEIIKFKNSYREVLVNKKSNIVVGDFSNCEKEGISTFSGKGKIYIERKSKIVKKGNQMVLIYDGNFKGGLRHGLGKEFDDHGILKYEGEFFAGERNASSKTVRMNIVSQSLGSHDIKRLQNMRKILLQRGREDVERELNEKENNNETINLEESKDEKKLEVLEHAFLKELKNFNDFHRIQESAKELRKALNEITPMLEEAEKKLTKFDTCYQKKITDIETCIFKGNFVNGVLEGEGSKYILEGKKKITLVHQGNYKKGRRNGFGKEYWRSCNLKYEGNFVKNHYHGSGTLYNTKGKKVYHGNFAAAMKEGLGVLYEEDEFGDMNMAFKGQFRNDEKFMMDLDSVDLTEVNLDQILEGVEFKDRIGKGGFGEVYRVNFKGLKCAVKILNFGGLTYDDKEDLVNKTEKTLKICCSFDHPNILKIYGWGKVGRIGYVMELCEKSVQDLIVDGKIPLKRKVMILYKTSIAMEMLHWASVIHRDLKWENVLVDKLGEIKVIDFDLAVYDESFRSSWNMYERAGTNLFMAPQVIMKKKYDKSCDVYSFGIMMYCLIFEKIVPFEMTNDKNSYNVNCSCGQTKLPASAMNVHVAKCKLRPTVPEKVDEEIKWLVELMKSCWIQDPSQRPTFYGIKEKLREEY